MQERRKSDFLRRLKFYVFGLLLGIIIVQVITKGKACQMPSTVKLEELYSQHMQMDDIARCQMGCRGIAEKDIRKIMEGGSVNYGESQVHAKPFGLYAVDAGSGTRAFRFIIEDRDTISYLMKVLEPAVKDTCVCLH